MSLRTALISIWTSRKEKDSFIDNELADMGPGKIPKKKEKKNVK